MNTEFEKIINPDLVFGFDDTAMRWIIKESDPLAKLKKIQITVDNTSSTCFTLDSASLKALSPYLNDQVTGLLCACDAILINQFCENGIDKQVDIFLIELKSETVKPLSICMKFSGSKSFIIYMQALLEEILDIKIKIRSIRNVLFSCKASAFSNPKKTILKLKHERWNYIHCYAKPSNDSVFHTSQLAI